MNAAPSQSASDEAKHLRIQQWSLLGIAVLTLAIGWLDGISGLISAMQDIQTKIDLVRIRIRWYFSAGLPFVTLATLALATMAHHKQRLLDVQIFVVSGVVAVTFIIAFSIVLTLCFSNWAEAQHYERCYQRDRTLGVTRYGSPNVEISAWTPAGQCTSE